MAYAPNYQLGYPYYQPQMLQQPVPVMPQQQMQQPQQAAQPQYQMMQGGFVRIPSENDARMYPVAPGNSVTFIDENRLYIYTKSVNMGQLDRPIFEKYRLVKEDEGIQPADDDSKNSSKYTADLDKYALAADFDVFRSEIEAIKADIELMRVDLYGIAGKKKPVPKKEVMTDE